MGRFTNYKSSYPVTRGHLAEASQKAAGRFPFRLLEALEPLEFEQETPGLLNGFFAVNLNGLADSLL
jgi:hypothetical protein